ncbi:MAG: hypothetical protein ACI4I7_01665 [Oscillospiraceae bacterium]
MQRIMSVNFTVNNRGLATTNKSLMAVNEMLSQGWKVAKIVCADENSNGVIGGFVVIEKDED